MSRPETNGITNMKKNTIAHIYVAKFKVLDSNLIIFEIKHGGDLIRIFEHDKNAFTGFFTTVCRQAKEIKIDYNQKKTTEERVILDKQCVVISQIITEEEMEYFSKRLSAERGIVNKN